MKTRFIFISFSIIFILFLILRLRIDFKPAQSVLNHKTDGAISTTGVCPPFYLIAENGDTINPATGQNTDLPYSPKQTCGKCHDYDLITEGYHFQQGKGEEPTENHKMRVGWASSPGNYGGGWCSPSPLYAHLASKENTHEQLIDMTSYDFVNKCGVCHPGGGSLEYDRNNQRYDEVMADGPFSDGAKNDLEGDYYKAKWQASGVIEADCFICHLPEYNNKTRVAQIQKLNYRYAALAGSGLGKVSGSVAGNEKVAVEYFREKFNADGTLEPNIVKEPRNTACLFCHAKPGYKKRGADFRPRNDVHLQAGMKCVDCHPAGSMAVDDRIREREAHQFGKGDDPSGLVRNDLDNTMRDCNACHDTGYLGAPIAKHAWLPSIHFEKMACQTCHIPERNVKSVHYVASDVFNPGTKISPPGKYLWTFYGPDMNYYNHYGDLEMMGYDDKPTFNFKPGLINYKGKIFPGNRVHSSFPAIMTSPTEPLHQPRMSEVYKMWAAHRKDNTKYPQLASISDDSGDGVFEINRPEEIDALIAAVSQMLTDINYPMEGKKVVWVMNDRVYESGNNYYTIPLELWEAAAFGNVHKYSHDIKSAESALGINGCTDCHSYGASFFTEMVLETPFDENGDLVVKKQYASLGLSGIQTHTGIVRESLLKPLIYWLILVAISIIVCNLTSAFLHRITNNKKHVKIYSNITGTVFFLLVAFIALNDTLISFIFPNKLLIDGNHFVLSVLIILGLIAVLNDRSKILRAINVKFFYDPRVMYSVLVLIFTVLSGAIMMLTSNWIFYNLFEIGLILAVFGIIVHLLYRNEYSTKQKSGITT